MIDLRNQRNSKKQGDIGLSAAMYWLSCQGYEVYVPLTDSGDADLVADINDKLCRIQVKTTYYKKPSSGLYQVNLRVSGGNRSGTGKVKHFDPEKVDYLFVLTQEESMYLIPSRVLVATNSISLGEKYEGYKVK